MGFVQGCRTARGQTRRAWVFQASGCPCPALFENLRDGASVEQFLEWFPGVEKWMAEAALEQAVRGLDSAHRFMKFLVDDVQAAVNRMRPGEHGELPI